MKLEFMECATCAAKPGAPDLCVACVQNRNAVSALERMVVEERKLRRDAEEKLQAIRGALDADAATRIEGPVTFDLYAEREVVAIHNATLGNVLVPDGWCVARNGIPIGKGDVIRHGDKLRLVRKPA